VLGTTSTATNSFRASPSPPTSTATESGRSAHRAASPSPVSPTKSCSSCRWRGPPRAAGTRSPTPTPRPLPCRSPRSRPTRPPRALVPGQTQGRPLRWRSSRPANPRTPRSAFATDPPGRSGGRPPLRPRDWFFPRCHQHDPRPFGDTRFDGARTCPRLGRGCTNLRPCQQARMWARW